jgi:putative IMPACT (imprinted ancient) family translation regulator
LEAVDNNNNNNNKHATTTTTTTNNNNNNNNTHTVSFLLKHDHCDDGEDAAGSRLSHLLELRRETNVFVVVSRWFGGTHLGPKRFAHINSVARELLVQLENMK